MTMRFDTIKGEFVDDSVPRNDELKNPEFPSNKRTRFIEIPEPNTILSGEGIPSDEIGNEGDFYIDTLIWEIYGPKADKWRNPSPLIGKQGPQGESVKGDIGERGKDGAPGISGISGISVTDIKQDNLNLIIALSNGVTKTFILPSPLQGKDGTGIVGIKKLSVEKIEIILSDGKSYPIDLPPGKDGKEIELRRDQMMVQWRYIGDEWKDLFPIPPITKGSGGAGIYELQRLTDVHLNNLQNGQTIVWSTTANKWINSNSGSGTVTSVSVVPTNGLAGTVATPTTTPAITLSTTITGILKGNGTAISAAVANTDYQAADASLISISGVSWVQGDVGYWSGVDTAARLAKDTNATRYLSNQGTSNNPSWNQVNLANGVTGDLPFANLTQITGLSVLGVAGSSTADVAAIGMATKGQVLRADNGGTTLAFGSLDLSNADTFINTLPINMVGAGFVKVDGSTPLTASWAANNAITGVTSLTVDNINIDGNTIISTNTNGEIDIFPNGSGVVKLGSSSNYLQVSAGGMMTFAGTGDYRIATGAYAFRSAVAPNAGLSFTNIGGNRFNFIDTIGVDLLCVPLSVAAYSRWGYATPSISPAQITADQNNYAGIGQVGVGRLDLDANHTITGIVAPGDLRGKTLTIFNISAFNLTLTHQDTASTAANRFQLPGGSSLIIGPNEGVEFNYDEVLFFWRGSKIAQNVSKITGVVASTDLTAQSAAIVATTIYAVPSTGAGMYRVSWVATITTAATTSSVLGGTNGFQVVFTSPTDSVVKTSVAGLTVTSAANTTATAISGHLEAYCAASTNLQYKFDYTSVGVTAMAYELHVCVEAI